MRDFLNAFMSHLHPYETVAVVLVLAAVGFLIFLLLRDCRPYIRPRSQRTR